MVDTALTIEQEDLMIALVATMVISSLAKKRGLPETDILYEFLQSKTAKMLYDKETKMWCSGPAYVEAVYHDEELQFRRCQNERSGR